MQQQKINVCLTLFYSEVQLTVPATTNVDSAVVDTHEVLMQDNRFIVIYYVGWLENVRLVGRVAFNM